MKSVLVALAFSVGMSLCGWVGATHAAPNDVPSKLPDLKMDCAAIYITPPNSFRSPPFNLYIEVYFAEKLARLTDEEGRTNNQWRIEDIVQNKENASKSIMLRRGVVSAIINMHFKDIMMIEFADEKTIKWAIAGRQCRIDPLG